MSSEIKPLSVRLGDRALDSVVGAVKGKGVVPQELVRNGIVYPIAVVAEALAKDHREVGNDKKAEQLDTLATRARQAIDDLKP